MTDQATVEHKVITKLMPLLQNRKHMVEECTPMSSSPSLLRMTYAGKSCRLHLESLINSGASSKPAKRRYAVVMAHKVVECLVDVIQAQKNENVRYILSDLKLDNVLFTPRETLEGPKGHATLIDFELLSYVLDFAPQELLIANTRDKIAKFNVSTLAASSRSTCCCPAT